MNVRVTRPPPMPNTVGTTAHLEGDHVQNHGVLTIGTEESADKTVEAIRRQTEW